MVSREWSVMPQAMTVVLPYLATCCSRKHKHKHRTCSLGALQPLTLEFQKDISPTN